ncbi:hypothetical protein GUJ93_ZPchr0004g39256 [Zizania palustris]|uniref:BHLH domain-containing protein n=1 Tax=Zizania palustris TaxID=103762 RepID=A0A8J5S720_ZIZPA|nr:hypothetical protein GUJ93_ZPchr0004g40518 [Zizania palustris]KAG8066029.1 hypothetical protein GUJ93_ZPchr0004g39256 [Zizania palustris]
MTLDALCGAAAPAGDVVIYDTFNASSVASADSTAAPASFGGLFGNAGGDAAGHDLAMPMAGAEGDQKPQGRRKRRRRARSSKSREDAENQRMTHIAVERNRRRQMNEYLAVLRSLMPESYVHRGDQASIVGGAIDFVKELEQLLQSLEAQKRTLLMQAPREAKRDDATPTPGGATGAATSAGDDQEEDEEAAADGPPFARFFTYPQYVWCHPPRDGGAENRGGVADIEVSLVETHASLRVMAPRRPGQLLKMVAGLQELRLTVLHLNVTALGSLALYSISVKVEEGCGMATVDDIAAAVHHVLCIIDAEAAASAATSSSRLRLLDSCQARWFSGESAGEHGAAELAV